MKPKFKENIQIHGNYQCEIKQNFNFSSKQKKKYFIDTYIFFPHSLNVNEQSYTKEDFYKDLSTNIRLKTPKIPLDKLKDDVVFNRIQESIDELERDNSVVIFKNFRYQIKMFTMIFKKAMDRQIDGVRESNIFKDASNLTGDFIKSTYSTIESYRALQKRMTQPEIGDNFKNIYFYGDEYLSLKIESSAIKLYQFFDKSKYSKSKTSKLKTQLIKTINSEINYRKEHNYPAVATDQNSETFLYRMSLLKKYLSNILFLETYVKRDGKVVEQIIYSIAAGLAMLFATAVAFIGENQYGKLTLPFFIALIISYMFKDRMKELLRIYFTVGMKNYLYDRKRYLFHSFKQKIGICKESFNYVPRDKIPKDIIELRHKENISSLEKKQIEEKIIHYRKMISLSPKAFKLIRKKYITEGVIDIVRINVETFLKNMDNPEKKVFMLKKNKLISKSVDRVYHINMITKYFDGNHEELKHFRLILNRNGIIRIEE